MPTAHTGTSPKPYNHTSMSMINQQSKLENRYPVNKTPAFNPKTFQSFPSVSPFRLRAASSAFDRAYGEEERKIKSIKPLRKVFRQLTIAIKHPQAAAGKLLNETGIIIGSENSLFIAPRLLCKTAQVASGYVIYLTKNVVI